MAPTEAMAKVVDVAVAMMEMVSVAAGMKVGGLGMATVAADTGMVEMAGAATVKGI